MRAHPVRHELAGHDDVERAAVGIEPAELGRLQPAVKRAGAKVAPKSAADRLPGGIDRCHLRCRPKLDRRIRPSALHWSAPPLKQPPWADKASPCARLRVARQRGSFLSCPQREIRAWKDVSESVRASLQVPIFHKSEIMALDTGKRSKPVRNGRKPPIVSASTSRLPRIAGKLRFFRIRQTRRAASRPAARCSVPKWAALRRLAARLSRARRPASTGARIFRDAVFLWMTPRATPRNSSGCAF